MITIFHMITEGPKKDSAVFLRLLVGELWTPKLVQIFAYANGYTHTECYDTARQIWTKDVRKRVDRRSLHSERLPLLPKLPSKPHFGGPYNAKPSLRELSVSRTLMELRS